MRRNVLYRNNGDGTFTDVTEKAGLKGKGWGGDVAVFDYNEDGHLDLLVTNMFGASQLYRNNGTAPSPSHQGSPGPHFLGRHRFQGVRLQQRWPPRSARR